MLDVERVHDELSRGLIELMLVFFEDMFQTNWQSNK